MKNIALITGITGQDGSYLAEFLLEYEKVTEQEFLQIMRGELTVESRKAELAVKQAAEPAVTAESDGAAEQTQESAETEQTTEQSE